MPPIGNMEIVLSADAAALLGALDRIERRMGKAEADTNRHAAGMAGSFQRVGRAISGAQALFAGFVAAVATSRLIGWFNQAAEEVDKLGKAALRLGLSVEEMSVLRFAAKESGVEFEKLATLVGKAGRQVAELVTKGQGVERIGALTVQLTDANGEVRNLAELLPDIARGIESAGSSAEQLRLAEKFFGRGGGAEFVTWLKESGRFIDGLADGAERASRLNVLFTQEQFEKLRAYNDAVGRISDALLGLRVNILTRVAPALEVMANKTASAIAALPEIVERLVGALDQAFSAEGGPLADKLEQLVGSLGDVARRGTELAVRVAYGVAVDMLGALFPALAEKFRSGYQASIIEPLEVAIGGAAGILDMFVGNYSMSTAVAVSKAFGVLRTAMETEARLIGSDVFAAIDEEGAEWQRQWMKGSILLSGAFGQLVDDADELLDISGALSRHAMTGFERVGEGAKAAAEQVTELQKRMAEMAENGNKAISGFASSASDALADFALEGKADLEDLAKSWTKTLLSMAAQALVFKPLFEGLGAGFGNLFSQTANTGGAGGSLGPTNPIDNAHGNVFQARGFVHRAAKGMVLNQRTYFPGMNAEAAEAGHPEWAFAPLRRIGGDLGVKSSPANVAVQVFDQRGSGARPQVSEHSAPDGSKVIRVMVRDEIKRGMSDGSLDGVMSSSFGLRRRGAAR
jgi:hypothetical protein